MSPRQRAATLAAQMKSGDFDAAAKAAGVEVEDDRPHRARRPDRDVGVSPAVDAVAFALPAGGVSDPIVTDNGAVIVKVLERKDPTAERARDRREATARPSCSTSAATASTRPT